MLALLFLASHFFLAFLAFPDLPCLCCFSLLLYFSCFSCFAVLVLKVDMKSRGHVFCFIERAINASKPTAPFFGESCQSCAVRIILTLDITWQTERLYPVRRED